MFTSISALSCKLLAPAIPALLAGTATVQPVAAQEAQITISSAAYGGTRQMELDLNKSIIVDLPAGVAEVVVSQPTVAAAIMRTRTRAIVQGISGGDTNIFFLDDQGRTISVLDIRVIKEPSRVGNALQEALARVIPGSNIRVESVTPGDDTNRVVLTGTVLSSDDKERAQQVAVQFAGDPQNVANILDISGSQQVMLQVTVAEVSRDTVKQLGINLSGSLSIGNFSAGINSAQSALTNGVNANFGGSALTAELRALEQRGSLRTSAEPVLTAISGQPAEFLAGGQIPILSAIDPATNNRTYTLKDFGVKLKFTPTIKSNGVVGLEVETEVSEIAETGFNIGGETVPGFNNRNAKTSIELRPGQTIAIAGMIRDKLRQQISGLPGLGDIPIPGTLFRSRNFQRSQTELVIIVTPYLAAPMTQQPILPTDKFEAASDAEAIFLGRMERNYGVGGDIEMRGGFNGSVGFVLD
ncbi:type II and III secretion system protein family protein [Devosia sp. A8/3-2]|nr:type II and III secretion system protein family protein [Devosia sp. A8/3-2]